MDVFIDNHQLNYIFSQNYKIDLQNTLFPYKIWVPWVHITEPFYIEDACFYSHISVMKKLSPYIISSEDDKKGNLFRNQEQAHVRWFLLLAREYNLYKDSNTYNNYSNMTTKFIFNEITKNILIKYRSCIKDHFIINTLKEGILFHKYNNINFYKKPSNNIIDIINNPTDLNLKIVYNNDDFFSIDLEV